MRPERFQYNAKSRQTFQHGALQARCESSDFIAGVLQTRAGRSHTCRVCTHANTCENLFASHQIIARMRISLEAITLQLNFCMQPDMLNYIHRSFILNDYPNSNAGHKRTHGIRSRRFNLDTRATYLCVSAVGHYSGRKSVSGAFECPANSDACGSLIPR